MNIKLIAISTAFAALAGGAIGYMGASGHCSATVDRAKATLSSRPAMSVVTGEIVAIAGDVITIRSQSRSTSFEDIPKVHDVTVTRSTTFIKSTLKSTPTISDLKLGDVIEVDAGRDIGTLSSFDAVKITYLGVSVPLPSPAQPSVR